eukprot:gene20997-23049_t
MWYNNLEERKPAEYRFTRVIFGAASSPYILGATLQKHVSDYLTKYPETAKALLLDTYVDDIQYGTDSLQELEKFKVESTEIMNKGGFTLHKWHSTRVLWRLVPFKTKNRYSIKRIARIRRQRFWNTMEQNRRHS